VREAVGPDIDLMIDGYHWYSRAEALYIGKALEKLDFAWFEESFAGQQNASQQQEHAARSGRQGGSGSYPVDLLRLPGCS
jgi:L-alanine-DL-glutamate epimerase-like enolase superfamily enzyme